MGQTKPPRPGAAPKTLVALLGGAGAVSLLLATLTSFEGKRNVGYLDIAKIPTACMGDTKDVVVGKFYSDAECQARLERQATVHVAEIVGAVPGAKGDQLVAFGSLAYNIGSTAFRGSSVARRWQAGDRRGACDAILAWNKARVNGKLVVVRGLANRRAAERALCLKGLDA